MDAVVQLELPRLRELVLHVYPRLARIELPHIGARAHEHAQLAADTLVLVSLQTFAHLIPPSQVVLYSQKAWHRQIGSERSSDLSRQPGYHAPLRDRDGIVECVFRDCRLPRASARVCAAEPVDEVGSRYVPRSLSSGAKPEGHFRVMYARRPVRTYTREGCEGKDIVISSSTAAQ